MAESCCNWVPLEPKTESLKVESAKRLVWHSGGSPERSTVAGFRDVFGILPTGYGKSLCYGHSTRSAALDPLSHL